MQHGVYAHINKAARERQKKLVDIFLVLKVVVSIRHIQVRERSKFVGTRAPGLSTDFHKLFLRENKGSRRKRRGRRHFYHLKRIRRLFSKNLGRVN